MKQARRIVDFFEKALPKDKYTGNKELYKKEVEQNVNNIIKEYRDKIILWVDEIGNDEFSKYCYRYKQENDNICRKIHSNKCRFLKKENEYYVFDLSYVYSNCYIPEFEDGVKDVLIDFFVNEIIQAIIVVEYIDSKSIVDIQINRNNFKEIISNIKFKFLYKIHIYLLFLSS